MKTTPEQRIERNELLAKALQANEKKAKEKMRKFDGGRCCLCVARDVAIANGLELPEEEPLELPEVEMGDWYGWDCYDARLVDDETGEFLHASCYNDGMETHERTHKEIAAMFRNTFCKP